jgi:hypothetical protein
MLLQQVQEICFYNKGDRPMKKVIVFSVSVLVILALAVIFTAPGTAKATRITTCSLQTNTSEIPGKMWFSEDGSMLHIRGQTTYANIEPLPGHPECAPEYSMGQLVMEVNINLNLVTGEGNAYGTHTITSDGFDGTWNGVFNGKIDPSGYSGKATAHGTGDLEGMLQKIVIQQTGATTYETHGYVLIP